MSDAPAAFRVLPRVTPQTEFFWSSGADGVLRFLTCTTCGTIVHPPSPLCPVERTKTLEARPVSGRATVATYTVNHQPWIPSMDPPYVIALVELVEDPRVRLMTNIVDCDPGDVRIGMLVEVVFERYEDVWLPLFRPVGGAS